MNTAEEEQICMTDAMRKFGGCCISANAIRIAEKLYAKSDSIDTFLMLLNEADIGGQSVPLKLQISVNLCSYSNFDCIDI